MDPLTIRTAEAGDLDAVLALNAEVQALHHGFSPALYPPAADAAGARAFFAGLIGADARTILLATGAGGPIGYAALMIDARSGTPFSYERTAGVVDQICVAAGARRRGVGRALLSAARDWMIARGATRLEASIHAANDPSRALFAAAGFAPTIIRVAAAI